MKNKFAISITDLFSNNKAILCKINSGEEVHKALEANLSENEVSAMKKKS